MNSGMKIGLIVGLPVLGLVGYLALAHLSGGAYPTLGMELGGDQGWLRRTSLSFWEDIQFKDFEKAATYHAPDKQESVDIPYLLQRLFLQKPELLDIMRYEIVMVDLDSSGLRARVKTRVKVKNLVNEKIMERDLMLFWKREREDQPWYMDLESSLRQIDAEKGKEH